MDNSLASGPGNASAEWLESRRREEQAREEQRRDEAALADEKVFEQQQQAAGRNVDGAKAVVEAARDESALREEAQQIESERRDDRRFADQRRRETERRADAQDQVSEPVHGMRERLVVEQPGVQATPRSSLIAADHGAPRSFADAADRSRGAISAATISEQRNAQFKRDQERFDQRIQTSRSPAERERLINEKDLQKQEHMAQQKARLLADPQAAIGKDAELRARLETEVEEHNEASRALREKLHPENHAFQRVMTRADNAQLDAAKARVSVTPDATCVRVEAFERRLHEKLQSKNERELSVGPETRPVHKPDQELTQ